MHLLSNQLYLILLSYHCREVGKDDRGIAHMGVYVCVKLAVCHALET